NLYAEVLATCHLRAVRRRPMPRLDATGEPPQKVLRRWIRWFLELLLVDGSGPLGRLMAREMADPTPTRALETLAERSMLPMLNGLRETLMALLPGGLGPVQVQLFLHSVVGQCLFYRHAQPALERLHRLHRDGSLPGDPRAAALGVAPYDLDRLADHIATFSLAGLATADPAGAEP
ncbi:MAG: CerR family C-terminal domain-containing protein, partial [Acidobacteriota bacterium]